MKRMALVSLVFGLLLTAAACAGNASSITTATTIAAVTTIASSTTSSTTTTTTLAPTTTTSTEPTTTTTTSDLAPALEARAEDWFTLVGAVRNAKTATVKKIQAFMEPGPDAHQQAVDFAKAWASANNAGFKNTNIEVVQTTITDDGSAGAVLMTLKSDFFGQKVPMAEVTHWIRANDEWFRANNTPRSEISQGSVSSELMVPLRVEDVLWTFYWVSAVKTLKSNVLADKTSRGVFLIVQFTVENLGNVPISPDKYSVSVVDVAGNAYAPSPAVAGYFDQEDVDVTSPINPGLSRNIIYVFEAPANLDLSKLLFSVEP